MILCDIYDGNLYHVSEFRDLKYTLRTLKFYQKCEILAEILHQFFLEGNPVVHVIVKSEVDVDVGNLKSD